MPHEVADLEPVLAMLSKQDINDLQVVWLIYTFFHVNALLMCQYSVIN